MTETLKVVQTNREPVTVVEKPGVQTRLYALTVDQYHQMIDEGILPDGEPFELIEGQVVQKERNAKGSDPMTVGREHAVAVTGLGELTSKLRRFGCHVRTQQPITIRPHNEPEPDAAFVVGAKRDYLRHHPSPRDVYCVIEVADATLDHDRTTKLRVYATAAIPQYVIFNLPDRAVEVYTEPLKGKDAYGRSVTLGWRDAVTLSVGRGRHLRITGHSLLP